MKRTYRTFWSDEDDKYVGVCDQHPYLSWLAPTRNEAFAGIQKLVADVDADMANDSTGHRP